MDRGYIHLWRKSLDSMVFKDQALWKVWTWCLMKANHKPKTVAIKTGRGNTVIKIKRGQFIFGRNQAAEELDMKPTSVRRRMIKLKNLQKCDIQPDTHFSIVTVLNYDQFNGDKQASGQLSGQASDRQVTGNGQASDTTNNDKHYKHYKNEDKTTTTLSNEKSKEIALRVLDYLNQKTGKHYRNVATNIDLIKYRLQEGFQEKDFYTAIDNQISHWKGNGKWDKFLRPATLFQKSKFDGYVNAGIKKEVGRYDHEPNNMKEQKAQDKQNIARLFNAERKGQNNIGSSSDNNLRLEHKI